MEDWLSHPGLMIASVAFFATLVFALDRRETSRRKRREYIIPRAREEFIKYVIKGWHPDAAADEVRQRHDVSIRELNPKDALRTNFLALKFAERRWKDGSGFQHRWDASAAAGRADEEAPKSLSDTSGTDVTELGAQANSPTQGVAASSTGEINKQLTKPAIPADCSLRGNLTAHGYAFVHNCVIEPHSKGDLELVALIHSDATKIGVCLEETLVGDPWCVGGPTTDKEYYVAIPLRLAEILVAERQWPTCPKCASRLVLQRTHQSRPRFWWECETPGHLKVALGTDSRL